MLHVSGIYLLLFSYPFGSNVFDLIGRSPTVLMDVLHLIRVFVFSSWLFSFSCLAIRVAQSQGSIGPCVRCRGILRFLQRRGGLVWLRCVHHQRHFVFLFIGGVILKQFTVPLMVCLSPQGHTRCLAFFTCTCNGKYNSTLALRTYVDTSRHERTCSGHCANVRLTFWALDGVHRMVCATSESSIRKGRESPWVEFSDRKQTECF